VTFFLTLYTLKVREVIQEINRATHSETECRDMLLHRFLITGAMGCIGAWIVRNLVSEGVPVVSFDLASDGHRLKLIMTPDELARVTFVDGDITDLPALEHALDTHAITHVIHLAALQMPFVKADPQLGAQINVVGTVNVFEAVARYREQINRIVYASSVAVYDTADAGEPGAVVQHNAIGKCSDLTSLIN
jgi:UDP-glucuronate 4-epimerase